MVPQELPARPPGRNGEDGPNEDRRRPSLQHEAQPRRADPSNAYDRGRLFRVGLRRRIRTNGGGKRREVPRGDASDQEATARLVRRHLASSRRDRDRTSRAPLARCIPSQVLIDSDEQTSATIEPLPLFLNDSAQQRSGTIEPVPACAEQEKPLCGYDDFCPSEIIR